VYGAILVNLGKSWFSESFPNLWLYLMAAMFIGVVMAFPNGLAGLYEEHVRLRVRRWLGAANKEA
jgi:urea transport system permease protein